MKRATLPPLRLPLLARVAVVYVVLGLPAWTLVSSYPQASQTAYATQSADKKPTVTAQQGNVQSGYPVELELPRIGLILKVAPGSYDETVDAWTLSDDKAHYADITSLANNTSGNTFMYGHNTAQVFAPLYQLQPGDTAIVRTSNGLRFQYVFNGTQTVNPTATTVLATSETSILTLMTCEGVFDEARRIVVFDFERMV